MNTIFYHKPASKALSEFDVHESLNLILRNTIPDQQICKFGFNETTCSTR